MVYMLMTGRGEFDAKFKFLQTRTHTRRVGVGGRVPRALSAHMNHNVFFILVIVAFAGLSNSIGFGNTLTAYLYKVCVCACVFGGSVGVRVRVGRGCGCGCVWVGVWM